jgi:hypothetical protein
MGEWELKPQKDETNLYGSLIQKSGISFGVFNVFSVTCRQLQTY